MSSPTRAAGGCPAGRPHLPRSGSIAQLSAALLLVLAACSSTERPAGACESDAECPGAGTRCNLETKLCICTSDEACKDDQFCNGAGICQDRSGCLSSSECGRGSFCDLASGQCLADTGIQVGGACGLATHCPYGSVCSAAGQCAPGCFDDGDCVLGDLCRNGACVSGDGICSTDAFCDYRDRCVGEKCARDFRGPYCRGCSPATGADPVPCDDPRNFCLVNSAELGGHRYFCGVDCSLGQPCPNGYACHGILILTEDVCTNHAECQCPPDAIRMATRTCTVAQACDPKKQDGTPDPVATHCVFDSHLDCNPGGTGTAACVVGRGRTGGSCTCDGNEDCEAGAQCVSGACCTGTVNPTRECAVGEGRVSGFCTCSTDDECPRDNCNTTQGSCEITGKPCTPGGNECGAIPCVEGACLIGNNCAPDEGLSCSVVGG